MTNEHETFRTVIPLDRFPFSISHSHSIMCVGSCFAERLSERMSVRKFRTIANPTGILFNPLSIAAGLSRLAGDGSEGEEPLFFHEDRWHSFSFHSRFSHPDRDVCLRNIMEQMRHGREFLRHADFLIVTLGTDVAYRLKSDGSVVANCHQMPSGMFEKTMLPLDEAFSALESALLRIRELRPEAICILTVSPVRYIRNDFAENSCSKAVLRLVCQRLVNKYTWICYFPAFEIMNDDLRDYRFYAADRIHPSEEAVDYIWRCFSGIAFSEDTCMLNRKIEEIEADFRHRPAFPQSERYRQFCSSALKRLRQLKSEHPEIDFSEEEQYFADMSDIRQ